jgi:TatD DNase family protein
VIDFHCHLDLYDDPSAVGRRATSEGIYLLAVTTTPRAWEGSRALFAPFPRVRVGLGLHPQVVAERHTEIDLLCRLIPEARYVGEVGLDGSPECQGSADAQLRVFPRALAACADHGGRILSLHSRNAASPVLDALETYAQAGLPVLHWFSGTLKELDRAINLGCWFSVGPAMLRTQKGRALVGAMPRDRVLTETDGPFTQHRRAPLMPWDVIIAERQIGEIWEMSESDVRDRLLTNFRQMTKKFAPTG